MSGEPETPSSDTGRTGKPRQDVPAASPPALHSDQERRDRSDAARYAGVGLQFAITLLIGLGLGSWADRKFGTSIFVLVGVFLGAGAAFYSMYRQLMANLERDEQAKRARRGSAGDSSDSASRERRGPPGGYS
jgi:F0F1-type ATP synthase assembly protein I